MWRQGEALGALDIGGKVSSLTAKAACGGSAAHPHDGGVKEMTSLNAPPSFASRELLQWSASSTPAAFALAAKESSVVPPAGLLVVYKKSKLDLYVKDHSSAHVRKLLDEGSAAVAQYQAAHDAHMRTLDQVKEACQSTGLKVKTVYRARLTREMCKGRVVIAVGGDGTLLDASRKVSEADVIGVNSDPDRSVGFLCASQGHDFAGVLQAYLDGDTPPQPITRLFGDIDGTPLPHPVLNDVLVAHKNPAATTSFRLRVGDDEAQLKSSGLWVCAPAGSTAAMASAGGEVQLLDDNRLQGWVREPYGTDGRANDLTRFFCGPDDAIDVMSKVREGRLYLDGPHKVVQFPLGAKLTLHSRGPRLRLVVSAEMKQRRRQLFKDRQG